MAIKKKTKAVHDENYKKPLEKGMCTATTTEGLIRRSKYSTLEDATTMANMSRSLNVIPANYVIYECKECNKFHFGKPEWAQQLGK